MNEAWNYTGEFKNFSTKDRDERVKKLVSLIVGHKPLGIIEVMHHEHYDRHFKGKIAKRMDYPYFLCLNHILGLMITYQMVMQWHPNEPVDFIFDEQGKESDTLQRSWQFTVDKIPPDMKHLLGNRPIHRDEM